MDLKTLAKESIPWAFIGGFLGGVFSPFCFVFPLFSGGLGLSLWLRTDRNPIVNYRRAAFCGAASGLFTAFFSILFIVILTGAGLDALESIPMVGELSMSGIYERLPTNKQIVGYGFLSTFLCIIQGSIGAIATLKIFFPRQYAAMPDFPNIPGIDIEIPPGDG